MDISTQELKFLLGLLACPQYRSPLNQLPWRGKASLTQGETLARSLQERGWVAYEQSIKQVALTPAGQVLLGLDNRALPVTPEEWLVLQACREKPLDPIQLPPKVALLKRPQLLANLAERGLLTLAKVQITEVWLTPQGLGYLRDQCQPQGLKPSLSGDMLGTYVSFLRSSLDPQHPYFWPRDVLDLERVIETIDRLDQDLNTDNHLPLFYLREALQPPFSREQVNQALYELQRHDRLELISVQEVSTYTPSQLKAGIPQRTGGTLFFASLLR